MIVLHATDAETSQLCVPTCNIDFIVDEDKVPNPTNCSEFYICSDLNGQGDLQLSDDALPCPTG